jgi:hypothetical protein
MIELLTGSSWCFSKYSSKITLTEQNGTIQRHLPAGWGNLPIRNKGAATPRWAFQYRARLGSVKSAVIRAKGKIKPANHGWGYYMPPPTYHQIRDDNTITLMMPILHFLIRSRFWKLINHIRLNTPVTILGVRSIFFLWRDGTHPSPSLCSSEICISQTLRTHCYVTIVAIHNLRSFRNSRIFLKLVTY